MGTNKSVALPEGFELDNPTLPEGFELDVPQIPELQRREMPETRGQQLRRASIATGAGLLKGAANIGATLISPLDYAGLSGYTPAQRRAKLEEFAAQFESPAFKAGEITAEIAGTAGLPGATGNVVMKGARFAPKLVPQVAAAIRSGGFTTGAPAAAKALSLEAAKNAAIRVGGGAIAGAEMAALVNPEQAQSGAIIGGMIPVAGKTAGEMGKFLRNYIVNPLFKPSKAAMTKFIADAGGEAQAREAINRAIAQGKSLSGQPFTMGQAGKNAGLAATERARSAVNPEQFSEIYQAQRMGRVNALGNIAQDEIALQNALARRSANAQNLYGQVAEKPFPVTDELVKMAHRAKAGGAIDEARKIAAIEGRAFSEPIRNELGDVIGEAVKGGDLHTIKMGIDQAIGASQGPQKAALMQLKNDWVEWMGKQAPEYLAANKQFAAESRKINQMKIAQRLKDVLAGEAYAKGAEPRQATMAFLKALKNAPSIAKAEAGMRQPLNKIMEKGQMETIERVARELAKDVDLQTMGKGIGSDTAQKLARANILQSIKGMAGERGRAVANFLTAGAGNRVNAQLDRMLQSPEYAGKSLEQLTRPQRVRLANLLANPATRALITTQSK